MRDSDIYHMSKSLFMIEIIRLVQYEISELE
jgi:hypothetical protein